ncbi:MAG: translation initiation factor IF-3 [Chlorobi bacterium]|nr:translation initiation factor IF-3 [Chlorobiota bacterium]
MGKRRRKARPNYKDDIKFKYRVNEEIRVPQVRLVGDNIPRQGIYPIEEALRMAREMELDLVEVAPNADPPVCRIMDFNKFIFEKKKKEKEQKKKTQQTEVKEIRFTPMTDDHDFEFKLRYARSFLEDGDKVKAYVFFKGRQIVFKDRGEQVLQRMIEELKDIATVESPPKMEGRRMIMILAPIKTKKGKTKKQSLEEKQTEQTEQSTQTTEQQPSEK